MSQDANPGGIAMPRRHGSRSKRNSMVIHTAAGSVVGSLGRQGFSDTLRTRQSPFTITVDTDGDSAVVDDGDGGILESAMVSTAERVLHERQDLLRDSRISYQATDTSEAGAIDTAWDDAIAHGKISTSRKREVKVLGRNAVPLAITFFLQYSLTVASIFSVGHLGKVELGAVSLAAMTASITGFAFIQGMATSLDTLCAQSYGAGRIDLVGTYFLKCVMLTMVCMIPIVVLWFNVTPVLGLILPDGESEAELISYASRYLRIVSLGIPPYVIFECGKRFLQAQGIFHASTLVIMVCAPLNVLLNYVLVWNGQVGIGFDGAPLAVSITNWLMASMLILFVIFVDGKQCWSGFRKDTFSNWGQMVRLALPGVIMIESEFMAFEVLTLASSHLGTTNLAAQTILSTITTLIYEIPFALSVATSTRIANFTGAGLIKPAIVTTQVAIALAFILGCFDAGVLYLLRHPVASLLSSDEDVVEAAAASFGVCACMHVLDGFCSSLNGVLRGQGRQYISGYLNLFAYYVVGLPLAFLLTFKLGMGLSGLWLGISAGIFCAAAGSCYAIATTDWKSVVKAAARNTSV